MDAREIQWSVQSIQMFRHCHVLAKSQRKSGKDEFASDDQKEPVTMSQVQSQGADPERADWWNWILWELSSVLTNFDKYKIRVQINKRWRDILIKRLAAVVKSCSTVPSAFLCISDRPSHSKSLSWGIFDGDFSLVDSFSFRPHWNREREERWCRKTINWEHRCKDKSSTYSTGDDPS